MCAFRESRSSEVWRDCDRVEALLRSGSETGVRLRERRTVAYDTTAHPLRDAFAAALGVSADGLSAIHETWKNFSLEATHFADKSALLAPLTDEQSRAWLQDVYDRIMLEVVVPDAASVLSDSPECSAVLYQVMARHLSPSQ